jgi:cyclic pyranopterin phosphate synthase
MMDLFVPWTEMRASLGSLVEDGEPAREADRGPARYLRAKGDPGKRVGFISGTSDTYCQGCDRLRVASDGTLRPCLATEDGVAAGGAARAGDSEAVAVAVVRAWEMKPDGEVFKGCTEDSAARVSIRAIGG